jgi:two-component system chemotaxis response regulator CheY
MCKRVLIVDDDVESREMLSEIFKGEGYPVVGLAETGLEAVQLFSEPEDRAEVVIMDYAMPGMNGIEAAREILEIAPDTNVVMVSGNCGIKQEALASGISSFFAKPFPIGRLFQAL